MRNVLLIIIAQVVFALTFKVSWLHGDQPFISYKPWSDQRTTVCSNITLNVEIKTYLRGIGERVLFAGPISGCKNITLPSLGPLALLADGVKMDVTVGGIRITEFEYVKASTGDLCVNYRLFTETPLTPGQGVLLAVENVCPFEVTLKAVIDPLGIEFFDVALAPQSSYLLTFRVPKIFDRMLKDVYFVVTANSTNSIIFSIPTFNYIFNYIMPFAKVIWFSSGSAVAVPEGPTKACVVLPQARPALSIAPTGVEYEVYQELYAAPPKLVAKMSFTATKLSDFERCVEFYAERGFPILGYYVVIKVGNVQWRMG
ncbi:MAG: hypothetical protein GXO07_06485 [Crenarchaeota archaeon]|nr:hypothetical protein [Thermoproteota archaeon]